MDMHARALVAAQDQLERVGGAAEGEGSGRARRLLARLRAALRGSDLGSGPRGSRRSAERDHSSIGPTLKIS
jgi:hypothetical protein